MEGSFFYVVMAVALYVIYDGFFVVRQKTAAIIERLGKFERVANPGLQLKIPFIDRIVFFQNMRIRQLDVEVETKTLDNVFVLTNVSVQFFVLSDKIEESYYKLESPETQIEAYIFDVVRSEIPKMTLDDVFANKDAVALAIKDSLSESMDEYGFSIAKSLVTDIQPDKDVKDSMNRINATERDKVAAENEAEASKIKRVKEAEGEAESKRLQGVGLAAQRLEIAGGIREAMETISQTGAEQSEVMTLLLMTQHYDTVQDVTKNSKTNTLLLPYSANAVGSMAEQIRESMLAVNKMAEKD